MITRRCTQRQFLMRPDRETNNAFIYCLAVAAAKFGIRVLFTAAMSNHHHTGIYDPDGCYPAFIEHFHKLFAKCQNALRGRWENFWSSEQTSVVRLVDPQRRRRQDDLRGHQSGEGSLLILLLLVDWAGMTAAAAPVSLGGALIA